jgi:hypothetical protein
MAPVAAERLKYGKTLVSDPRRSLRLLDILEKVQRADVDRNTEMDEISDFFYSIPLSSDDRQVYIFKYVYKCVFIYIYIYIYIYYICVYVYIYINK